MSQFALEWTKRQHDIRVQERLLMILLGVQAKGANHAFTYGEERILADAAITKRALDGSLRRLAEAGLIRYSWERYRSIISSWTEPDVSQLVGQLLIPNDWRAFMVQRPKGDSKPVDRPCAVYRLFDASGVLLYIGKAVTPPTRLLQHQDTKFWWPEVVTREVVWFETEDLAEAEEVRAIQAENPVYNIKDANTIGPGELDRRTGKTRRYVVTNSRFARFQAALDVVRKAIGEASYGNALLPSESDLAHRFGLEPFVVTQVLYYLVKHEELEVVEDDGHRRYQFVFYG